MLGLGLGLGFDMSAPLMCGIAPMYGSASGGHGRMHACTVEGSPPSRLDMVEKESVAALTRLGSASTWPGGG